jgi:beta-glucanase (GH16 family)
MTLAAGAISVSWHSMSSARAEQTAFDLSQFHLIWRDEFDGATGSRPAPHWFFFDGWGLGKWRDAYYTKDDAYLDGSGHLVIRARLDGAVLKTSYLQTYDWSVPESRWTTFCPGKGKYVEARIKLSDIEAGGLWPGFWLFDPSDTYDGDPANGTEIDIMEYLVSFGKPTSWTKHLPHGTFNYYNVANHWGKGKAESEGKYVDAGAHGVNLRDGEYHTFAVEWYSDSLTYYLDGRPIWFTKNGVSTSDGQALLISMEYNKGPGDAWGLAQLQHRVFGTY